MKKLILVLVAVLGLTWSAQAQTETVETPTKTSMYVGVGLSMSNSTAGETFTTTSYPSLEVGVTRNDVSYGVVLGRGSLDKMSPFNDKEDGLSNYFWELKVSPSFNLGQVNGNLILGAGSYFASNNAYFIEYGIGVSKSYGNLTYGVSYTNWDGVDYVTPSVSFGF